MSSRRDYDEVAAILRDVRQAGGDVPTITAITERIMNMFASRNWQFSKERFLSACGCEEIEL